MPNWCYTSIAIHHDDSKVIENLVKKIEEWMSKSYVPNGFDNSRTHTEWLGNIVGNSGIGSVGVKDEPNKDKPYYFCRGTLCDWSMANDNELYLSEETAWGPALKLWQAIIDEFAKGATITYTAEEGGMGLYMTNDEEYRNRYYIDWFEEFPEEYMEKIKPLGWESVESYYECPESETLKFLIALVPEATSTEEYNLAQTDEKRIDLLTKAFYESELSDCCGIHKWDFVEVAEISD